MRYFDTIEGMTLRFDGLDAIVDFMFDTETPGLQKFLNPE